MVAKRVFSAGYYQKWTGFKTNLGNKRNNKENRTERKD
jgi:hypothetical protein